MSKPAPFTDDTRSCKFCTKCGEARPIAQFHTTGQKVSGEPKYNSWCKTCIAAKQAEYHKRTWGPDKLQHSAFKRTKSVRSYLAYLRCKAVARKKGLEVASVDALEVLWPVQQGRCALTGWDMTMELGKGSVPTNCSIDRINSKLGYEVGNVQLVCRAANVAKSDLSLSDFLLLCRSVVEANDV
jgi:hypothetical protein